MAVAASGYVVGVDELGSHFVLSAHVGGELASKLVELSWARETGAEVWNLPAVPLAATYLRKLLPTFPALSIRPNALRLIQRVEELPPGASAVAHRCEHRPGHEGVVIAILPEGHLRTVLSELPRSRHDPLLDRYWIPAVDESLAALREIVRQLPDVTATTEVREWIEPFTQEPLSVEAVAGLEHRCSVNLIENRSGEVRLQLCRRCNPGLDGARARLGSIRGSTESWWVTIDGDSAETLQALLAERPQLLGNSDSGDILNRVRLAAQHADAEAELERLSEGSAGPTSIDGVTGTLRPFQGTAVQYATRARRTFIADEPGLGKTVEALASLEASQGFPALIACPASLRLNWLREAERWLPSRSARTVDRQGIPDADLTVVSYNALHEVAGAFSERPLRALVLDESHYCKNSSARRTQAALKVSEALEADAMVLLLTGTPVVNRPEELVSQLRVLGRPDMANIARRLARGDPHDADLQDLNRRLRRTCFIRRKKEAVLEQLPAKQRVVIPLGIENREEYNWIQADITAWLRAQAEADARFQAELAELPAKEREAAARERGREAEQRARRAEALVRVNKLALVAARGKLAGSIEWIEGFLESDKKLVVFARHREICEQLHAAFPQAALATGNLGPDRRNVEIATFQRDPKCPLIICSIDAAGVGITLTAASDVAFVEMAWTSVAHDQAEDRVHRIGQASSVTAWYLLAADTIDERLAAAVERKRRIASGATDGAPTAGPEALDAVLEWISEQTG